MIRQSCIKHGSSEVLVVFKNDDGTIRNHLLRDVTNLASRYTDLEKSADTRRQQLADVIASEQAVIDSDSFAQAEKEIAAAEVTNADE